MDGVASSSLEKVVVLRGGREVEVSVARALGYDRPTLYDYKKRFHGLQRYDWQTEQWKTFDRLV